MSVAICHGKVFPVHLENMSFYCSKLLDRHLLNEACDFIYINYLLLKKK